jgi:hypothetical protein
VYDEPRTEDAEEQEQDTATNGVASELHDSKETGPDLPPAQQSPQQQYQQRQQPKQFRKQPFQQQINRGTRSTCSYFYLLFSCVFLRADS